MTDGKIVIDFADPRQIPVVKIEPCSCKEYYLAAYKAAQQVQSLDNILYVGDTAPASINAYAWVNPYEDEDFAVSLEDALKAAEDAKRYAEIAESYVLPVATTTSVGGIKVGDNLTIDSTGRLNATGGDLSGYYTKEETDEAIANAIGGLINANEVGY